MYAIMFVLNLPDKLDAVLDAWYAIGVSGTTITESSGAYRRRTTHLGARYLFAVPQTGGTLEKSNFTLFVIVPDEATVQRCLQAAESVVGDLGQPDNGVLAAWELGVVKGVPDRLRDNGENGE